jgi:hypothetical protein
VTVLKKAIVKSYDAATHKATVQIAGSLGVWLDGVRVATDIPAADVVVGRQCTVLFLDPSNPDDAVIITIQGALPTGGGGATTFLALTDTPSSYSGQALKILRVNSGASAVEFTTPPSTPDNHAPVGALYPGVLSTGVKPPQVPYTGDGFTATKLCCRVSVAPQTQAITVQIRRNGTSLGTVTIAAAAQTGTASISQAVSDGDYFDINITQVGTAPNEGSDLIWLVAP